MAGRSSIYWSSHEKITALKRWHESKARIVELLARVGGLLMLTNLPRLLSLVRTNLVLLGCTTNTWYDQRSEPVTYQK